MEPAADSASRSARDAAFARGALVAGTLTLIACGAGIFWMEHTGSRSLGIRGFAGTGAGIALLALLAGRASFFSALWSAVLPPLAACLGASVLFFWNGAAYSMGVVWLTCYGLILLNLRPFFPAAIARLGWLFLGTGIVLMTLVYIGFKSLSGYDRSDTQTLLIMALTFGGFHLLHALGVLLNRRAGSNT